MTAGSCWLEQRQGKSVCLFVVDFLSFFEEHIEIQNTAEKTQINQLMILPATDSCWAC